MLLASLASGPSLVSFVFGKKQAVCFLFLCCVRQFDQSLRRCLHCLCARAFETVIICSLIAKKSVLSHMYILLLMLVTELCCLNCEPFEKELFY